MLSVSAWASPLQTGQAVKTNHYLSSNLLWSAKLSNLNVDTFGAITDITVNTDISITNGRNESYLWWEDTYLNLVREARSGHKPE